MLVATSFEANTAGFDLLGVLSGGAPSVSFSAAASREIILGGANTYTGVTGIGGAGVVKASVLADGGTASSLGTNTNINLSGAFIYTGTGDRSDRIWHANGADGIGIEGTGQTVGRASCRDRVVKYV